MFLLYLDDSGSQRNPNEDYFVLGGVALFEAQVHWLSKQLDDLALELFPKLSPQDVEFHASTIFGGREQPWSTLQKPRRIEVLNRVLDIFGHSYDSARAFAVAIHKASFPRHDLMELAFEDLCSRFDLMLNRVRVTDDRTESRRLGGNRGLFIFDKNSYEEGLQRLALSFRTLGTRWGSLRNVTEVPLFVDSKASRAVQVADHVAYSVFRRYNASDTSYLDRILHKFDQADGVVHGLVHRQTQNPKCMCPACLSRSKSS